MPEIVEDSSPTLQVDTLRVVSEIIGLSVRRGCFTIDEIDQVSSCYKDIKQFLEQWKEFQEKNSKKSS